MAEVTNLSEKIGEILISISKSCSLPTGSGSTDKYSFLSPEGMKKQDNADRLNLLYNYVAKCRTRFHKASSAPRVIEVANASAHELIQTKLEDAIRFVLADALRTERKVNLRRNMFLKSLTRLVSIRLTTVMKSINS